MKRKNTEEKSAVEDQRIAEDQLRNSSCLRTRLLTHDAWNNHHFLTVTTPFAALT